MQYIVSSLYYIIQAVKQAGFGIPSPSSTETCHTFSVQKIPTMARQMKLFDLERSYAFYGAYHNSNVNIFIHVLFVWPIFTTALMLFYFTPSFVTIPQTCPCGCRHGMVLNFGFLFTLVYAVVYVCMDKRAGSLGALLCFLCWFGASRLAAFLGFSLAWKVVLAAQFFCWTVQVFLGHGVFEKRAAALLDNLAEAFIMAPLFVLIKVLHKLFGYEPYPGFHEKVSVKIESDINEWKEKTA